MSVQARSYMQLIGWQNAWEQAPGVPATPSRPNGGGQPWPAEPPQFTGLSRPSPAPVVAQRQACEQQCPASKLQLWDLDRLLHVCTRERGATVGSKPSSPRLYPRNLLECTTKSSNTLSMYCGLLNSETMGTCLYTPTGMMTILKRNCNCGTSTVLRIWIRAFVVHTTGTTTLSKSCTCGTP